MLNKQRTCEVAQSLSSDCTDTAFFLFRRADFTTVNFGHTVVEGEVVGSLKVEITRTNEVLLYF